MAKYISPIRTGMKKRWRVQITLAGKLRYFGQYRTKAKAIETRDKILKLNEKEVAKMSTDEQVQREHLQAAREIVAGGTK